MAPSRRIALYVVLGTLVTTVAAIVFLVTAGPGLARGLAQDYVTEATGRAFAIGGPLEIEWGRRLGLTVRNVTLANAEWADSTEMLSLERAYVAVDLWSILAGPVYVERIEVDTLVLHLQGREDEPANWEFPRVPDAPAPAPDTAHGKPGPRLVVGQVQAKDLLIHLSSPSLDRPMDLAIRRLRQEVEAGEAVVLDLDGTVNEQPLSMSARVRPLASVMAGRNIDYVLEGHIGRMSVSAKGSIDDLYAPDQPTAELTITGPDIGALTENLGLGRIGEGDYDLTASLAPRDGVLAVRSQGRIGRIEIDVDGSVRDFAGMDGVDLSAQVSGPAFGRVLRAFGLEGPDDPFEFRTRLAREGPRLRIEDTRFRVADAQGELTAALDHFPTMDDARIDLTAEGPDIEEVRSLLQMPGIATGPFTVKGHVKVEPDGTETLRLIGQTGLGRLQIDGRLGDPDTYVGTTLAIGFEGGSLAMVGRAVGLDHLIDEPFSLTGEIALEAPGKARVSDAALTLGGHRAESEGLIPLDHLPAGTDLRVSAAGPNLAVVLAMTGVDRGIPAQAYEARGHLGFEAGGVKLHDVQGTVGSARITGGGFVAFESGAVGTDLDVRAAGPDLHVVLAPAVARKYAPSAPFEARGRIQVTDAGVAIENVEGIVAAASIKGHGLVATRPGPAGSWLEATASGPDLARVAPDLPSFSPPAGPFELSGRMERGQDFLAVEKVRLGYGGATGRIDARFATPLGEGATSFDIDITGPNAKVLPIATGFEPEALPFTLKARGAWQADRWRIDDAQLRLADATAVLAGELSGLPEQPGGKLEFRAKAPSLAALGTVNGERLWDLPLDISATIGGQDGRLELSIPAAQLGRTDISGKVGFRPGDVPRLDAELRSDRLDTRELRRADEPPAEATKPDSPRAPGDRLIPDMPLPVGALRELDATLTYAAEELVLATDSARDARLHATLLDGTLRVEKLHISGDAGYLDASLVVVPDGAAADLALEMEATALRSVFLTGGRDTPALPLFSAELELQGRGQTWRGLAADLDGRGWLTSKGGVLPNRPGSGLLIGDFVTEVFTKVNPFAETDPTTEIECISMPFTVEQGRVSTLPAWVIRTDKLDIGAWGAVDLATEEIEFNFKTQPRKGLGIGASQIVNPFMKVVGTLNDPDLRLDPSGTLVTGTATVITGGAWLLFKGAYDSLFREKDPCGKVMNEYRKTLEP